MNILILGSGGREHALAWKISQSDKCTSLFCSPGNVGIESVAQCVDIDFTSRYMYLIEFCKRENIDLVIPGSEVFLENGVVDCLEKEGISVFGPSAEAAQLETSKAFSREICKQRDIPSPSYNVFLTPRAAKEYIKLHGAPIVVKADGLASGKGVFVANDKQQAFDAIDICFSNKLGKNNKVILEEYIEGREASLFFLCDGKTAVPFSSARDYKRAFDNDKGPNTGGMGAISPSPDFCDESLNKLVNFFAIPVLQELESRGIKFRGILYAGLILTDKMPKLLEYNVRFGDPECQALMPRLETDLLSLLIASCQGELDKIDPIEWNDKVSASVVMASKGYPDNYEKKTVIYDINKAEQNNSMVFHSNTERSAFHRGHIIANGGRSLSITSIGNNIEEARMKTYESIDLITWKEGFYRSDIGK